MNNKLALFANAARKLTQRNNVAVRKLYTDHIYPYPFEYMNNKVFPSMYRYRETWDFPPWHATEVRISWFAWRLFWGWFWYQLFHDPGALLGHHDLPDPNKWTDAELGIPPDEYGSYKDWLEKTLNEQ